MLIIVGKSTSCSTPTFLTVLTFQKPQESTMVRSKRCFISLVEEML